MGGGVDRSKHLFYLIVVYKYSCVDGGNVDDDYGGGDDVDGDAG